MYGDCSKDVPIPLNIGGNRPICVYDFSAGMEEDVRKKVNKIVNFSPNIQVVATVFQKKNE